MNEDELLKKFGMSRQDAEDDAALIEDETRDDGLIGPVYYGLHTRPEEGESMVSVTLRMPQQLLDRTDKAARRYHISRSEYVRRQLAHA